MYFCKGGSVEELSVENVARGGIYQTFSLVFKGYYTDVK